jgi:tRNA (guanine37-N1)-methyltransferase
MVVIDTISRLIPGVLGNGVSADTDSFMNGLLEYPQYSRPEIWRDKAVPPILLSGDHAKVDRWRKQQSLLRTKQRRPDLYEKYMKEHPDAEKDCK